MDDQNKNLILATALSFLVILVWFLVFPPEEPVTDPNAPEETTQQTQATPDMALTPPAPTAPAQSVPGASTAEASTPETQAARIPVETPRVEGSISLLGGRIDDLSLKDYKETLEPDSPIVRLLSPVEEQDSYYALYGWAPAGSLTFDDVPGPNTIWSVESGTELGVGAPVTLRWDNGSGLVFRRTIAIDENFLFTVAQSVENTTGSEVRMQPYGIVAQHGEPDTIGFFILHEGVVAMADGELTEIDYSDMPDMDVVEREGAHAEVLEIAENGWIGFTDKNWMTTLVPQPGQPATAVAKYVPRAEIYQVETRLPTQSVAAGATVAVETMLFAGAKEWDVIRQYQDDPGIQGFIDSIDWGWFYFLTKPIFWALHHLNIMIGNMGLAIIGLTLLIKALLFRWPTSPMSRWRG